MSSLTQDQVFQKIQGKIKRKYEDEKAFSSGVITKLLKELYDSNLQGPLVFYSQDENGLPIEKIAACIAGEKQYCTVASKSVFDAKDWQNRSKSADYLGHWPHTSIEDLIGDIDENDVGIERCCKCEEEEEICTCGYDAWVSHFCDFWHSQLLLRTAGLRGHGVFARRAISDHVIVGEYVGQIVPVKDHETVTRGEDAYYTKISIGELNVGPERTAATTVSIPARIEEPDRTQAKAWLDALHTGSITRFINHSCDSNTELLEVGISMERRAILVVTKRYIAAGEELTLDYHPEWFVGEQYCLCNTANCRNPPKDSGDIDTAEEEASEDETSDGDEEEYVPKDTSDSSEYSPSSSDSSGDSDTYVWDRDQSL
jgi:hypothetical protein